MIEVREDYCLKDYNTFGIDVKCKYFVESDDEEDLRRFVADCGHKFSQMLILGGGSNFLFTEDFDGIVFYPQMKGIERMDEDADNVWVKVGAGVAWDDFVVWAVDNELGGVENLSFIPGHVGAAPVQNVGAYGMEAGERIAWVEAIELDRAELVKIDREDCCFGYRDSIFKREWKNKFIITRVVFRLSKHPVFRLDYGALREEVAKNGGEPLLAHVREAVIRIRQAKLPDVKEWPNAGSFFKNPLVERQKADALRKEHPEMPVYEVDAGHCKLAAGWMIEQCGWKGRIWGKAGVYDKQALVLINRGGATGVDIACLANEVRKSVFMKFGLWIEPEVYVI